MYLDFFELADYPFRLTPDSDFLYMSEAHARAKAYMDYTIWNRDGFVVITGEVGTGKTTLIQKLLGELNEEVVVAKIFQTQLDEVEFLQAVLVEFGFNPFNAKKVELMDKLNTFLIDNFLESKQSVLIIDDAQNLNKKVLEEIRMLSGLETHKEKILHVILLGQPELNNILEAPDMEQLLQRVRLRFHIRPLTEEETADYMRHRLGIAGASDRVVFSDECIPIIFEYTGGIPRLINTLCDTAMTCAFVDGVQTVSGDVIRTAVKELQWVPYAERVQARAKSREAAPHKPRDASRNDGEDLRMLALVDQKIGHLERFLPALSMVADRLVAIEKHLGAIATELHKGTVKKPKNRPKR